MSETLFPIFVYLNKKYYVFNEDEDLHKFLEENREYKANLCKFMKIDGRLFKYIKFTG